MRKLFISFAVLSLFFIFAIPARAQSSVDHTQIVSILERLARLLPSPLLPPSSSGILVIVRDEPPAIKSVSGPAELAAGENGKWWIRVADPSASPLVYSVRWGDDGERVQATKAPSYIPDVKYQTIVFNHTYRDAGVYQIIVSATDQFGQTASRELSVKVI